MPYRPRRSMLYMPGSNARALEKARALPSDSLILDMEDAVAPDRKIEARAQIVAAIAAGGYGRRELLVRVNALDTPWGEEDLRAMATSGADGIVLPKVSSAETVQQASRVLQESGAPHGMDLWVMAETARCILDMDAIAAADRRLAGILMGTADLARETRIRHTPGRLGFIASLNLCVLAARANGLDIIDGVYVDIDNAAGLRAECEQGRDLGFDGKSLIHPRQLEVANEVFAPAASELERLRHIISAWREAEARGTAVVVVGGRMVERLHVEEAERQLAMAEGIATMGW